MTPLESFTLSSFLPISGDFSSDLGWMLLFDLLIARKKSKEMLKAEKSEDEKLMRKLEREKLERLLQQVGPEAGDQEEDSLTD